MLAWPHREFVPTPSAHTAPTPLSWKSLISESLIIAVLGVFAFHLSYGFINSRGLGDSYQYTFGPALSLACGGDFTVIDSASIRAFLAGYRHLDTHFRCIELVDVSVFEPNAYHVGHKGLLRAVATFWRIFGITWRSIVILSALLFAVTIVSSYVAFRAFSGRVVALVCSSCFALSALHLNFVTVLRDYGKAPFVIAGLAVCAHLVTRGMTPTIFVALSTFLALMMYVGALFRVDVIGMLPVVLISLALAPALLPVRSGSFSRRADQLLAEHRYWPAREIVVRGISFALCIVAIAAVGRLVESGLWGNILYGHFHPMLESMGVATGEYAHGTLYNDMYNYHLVNAHSMRIRGEPTAHNPGARVLAARDLYTNIVRTFPGDVLTNVVAATLRVARLSSEPDRLGSVLQHSAYWWAIKPLAHLRNAMNGPLTGLVIPLLALIALFLNSPRKGFWFLALFGWCGLVASGQWDLRHVFHMEFMFFMAVSVIFSTGWRVTGVVRNRELAAVLPRSASRLLVLAGMVALVPITLLAARSYQQAHVRKVFAEIFGAERAPLDIVVAQRPDTRSADLRFTRLWKYPDTREDALDEHKYLAIVFNPIRGGCDTSRVWVGLGYTFNVDRVFDFSQSYAIMLSPGGSTTLFVPVFRSPNGRFERAQVSNIACLDRIEEVIGDTSFVLTLVLGSGWEARRFYTRLANYEAAPENQLHFVTGDLSECRHLINMSSIIGHGSSVTRQNDRVRVRITAWGMNNLGGEDIDLKEGECLYLYGSTSHGPISVGLLHQQRWATLISLPQPGQFSQLMRIPRSGRYGLSLDYRGEGQPLVQFLAD